MRMKGTTSAKVVHGDYDYDRVKLREHNTMKKLAERITIFVKTCFNGNISLDSTKYSYNPYLKNRQIKLNGRIQCLKKDSVTTSDLKWIIEEMYCTDRQESIQSLLMGFIISSYGNRPITFDSERSLTSSATGLTDDEVDSIYAGLSLGHVRLVVTGNEPGAMCPYRIAAHVQILRNKNKTLGNVGDGIDKWVYKYPMMSSEDNVDYSMNAAVAILLQLILRRAVTQNDLVKFSSLPSGDSTEWSSPTER